MPAARRLDQAAVARRLSVHYRNRRREWLAGSGTWPLTVPLHPPTEREAARDLGAARGWIATWQSWQGPGEVVWTERTWSSLGTQRLPERLLLHNAEQVADWIGERERWSSAITRHRVLSERFPTLDVHLGSHYDWLADSSETEVERLAAVLARLSKHPDSGLYIRQLPIAGVDTKWISANRALVTGLLRALLGREGDLFQLAGLRREPVLLRMRLLDPQLRTSVGGLDDVTAPIEQIAALALQPSRVFIVENLQTGLAFAELPGSLVFMGKGYAVDVFGAIPWLRDVVCHYWGDIDTHGLAILDRLRDYLPQARSLLMNETTLLDHRDLWVQEARPLGPQDLANLDDAEKALYDSLVGNRWETSLRLEQERIAWDYAWERIADTCLG
ncbi:MAG: DUF2220 family protein [Chromatiaceae bacterium]|nr:DUF2220 family protein [Chromatiaceae bacterium]